ncbi:hypothetical protein BDF20DRAFT_847712 [Mycotypha africana]|uniref:uncharacterized protein n=1 Tax=Mycotypha africana TaxID=64632 RepID=UPI0023006254|nr:uncharacterized protein BDF20DRAFT_847712 [Mycotypha africana]KAI8992005.1 hypothetical protein BDF20DRAFT_847712 [Mycotypha africana]
MNGLNNILEYPDWITDNLAKLMENCGFSLVEKNSSDVEQHLQQTSIFKIGKAFVTTPLSYILDRQAPHAVLNKLEIVFDFGSNGQSKEFVTNWKRKFHVDTISEYMEYALNLILLKKTFYMYPLIFSSFYAKKLSQTSAYLPHIAQSLQKIYITSKSTMSVSNHEFSESMLQKLKVGDRVFKLLNGSNYAHSNTVSPQTGYPEECRDNVSIAKHGRFCQ